MNWLGYNLPVDSLGNPICESVCVEGVTKYRLKSSEGITAEHKIVIAKNVLVPKNRPINGFICEAQTIPVTAEFQAKTLEHERLHSDPYKEIYNKYIEYIRDYDEYNECLDAIDKVGFDFAAEIEAANRKEGGHSRFIGLWAPAFECTDKGVYEIIDSVHQ